MISLKELPKQLSFLDNLIVRKHASISKLRFEKFQSIIKSLINSPIYNVVPIYKFEIISDAIEEVQYYYDMKRLYPLEHEEKLIINSCEDNLFQPWEDEIKLISLGKEKYPNLIKFLSEVIKDLHYKDLHGGNVMKDEIGNYLLIDVEGFIF